MEIVEVFVALKGCLAFHSSTSTSHLLLLLSSLLHDEILNSLLLLTKILVLKLESVNSFKRKVKCILFFVHFCLLLSSILEFIVTLNAFLDYLLNIDISAN